MKITKENIEYFIFDYHEGNLSDADKAEVLNFIHLHPEYENDFTHWAQSYFHSEDSIKNYGIANKLLQTDVMPWYTNKWTVSIGGITFLAIGLYSYLILQKPELPIKTNQVTPAVITETPMNRIEKATPSSIDIAQQTTLATNQNQSLPQATIVSKSSELQKVITLIDIDTLGSLHTDHTQIENPPIQKNAVAKTDTVQNHTSTQDKNAEKAKKTPQKQKSGLRLKAEDKFIPTNPDF